MCRNHIVWRAVAVAWLATFGASAAAQAPAGGQAHHDRAAMSSPLFPSREASGTSLLPDQTPMHAVMRRLGGWDVMLHGHLFGQVLYEPGEQHRTGGFSSHQVSSVNWLMAMMRRRAGPGRLGLRAMASAEPWTVGDCGFINRLANGEMCRGDTIHDRQHPHDLLMELAADYDRPLRGSLRWQVYAGLAGEPALGPAAFPHRLSAALNPAAPIAHHWLDSSHVTFGLITTGVYQPRWKAELSVFNGREPDDRRADIDLGRLDSFSSRLTLMPGARLALQISGAHLHAAEAEFPPAPRSDVERVTASATYHRVSATRVWATTIAYGMNAGREVLPDSTVHLMTHALLLESDLSIQERHTWFGRVEIVGKPGHDLHVHEAPAEVFGVGKAQVGYVRSFAARRGLVPGIGGTASVSIVPRTLAPRYAGRMAPGFGVFLTLRPSRHTMTPPSSWHAPDAGTIGRLARLH
jgi:hypothetical protein